MNNLTEHQNRLLIRELKNSKTIVHSSKTRSPSFIEKLSLHLEFFHTILKMLKLIYLSIAIVPFHSRCKIASHVLLCSATTLWCSGTASSTKKPLLLQFLFIIVSFLFHLAPRPQPSLFNLASRYKNQRREKVQRKNDGALGPSFRCYGFVSSALLGIVHFGPFSNVFIFCFLFHLFNKERYNCIISTITIFTSFFKHIYILEQIGNKKKNQQTWFYCFQSLYTTLGKFLKN